MFFHNAPDLRMLRAERDDPSSRGLSVLECVTSDTWLQPVRQTFSSSGDILQNRTLRRWARDVEEKVPGANKILAALVTKWDPNLNQHVFAPPGLETAQPQKSSFVTVGSDGDHASGRGKND